MKSKIFIFILTISILNNFLQAQTLYDYCFEKKLNITVSDSLGNQLKMPWVGGMNSVQFSEVDLNLDGIKDLFAFDKTGYKVLTFINQGIADSVSYVYNPIYQKYFPEFYGWAKLLDYNSDNKADIFCYTPGGIAVYKNISDTVLQFKLTYTMLNSDMGSVISNIGVTYDDYPAIYDIDNDGDLDVLAFFGLGAYVQMHKNYSQELYGNSDTLLMKLVFNCWGNIAESSTTSQIFLNITCPWNFRCNENNNERATRHTGSTMLAGDFNGDNLTDLILGDVDYFNLTALYNGGNIDTAHIVSADTTFPGSYPVTFNSFPLPSYLDVNNDNLKDLIISPFSSNSLLTESFKSNWLYKNSGTPTLPNFNFKQDDFLQNQMIDFGTGAYPVIFDINSDGLQDIFVGNYGYLDSSYYEFGFLKSKFISKIAWLLNTGSISNPSFMLMTRDFANLSSLEEVSLFPAFADLNNDGDIDMLCGNAPGKLIYFENIAGAGNTPVFASPVYNYQNIDVGDFSAPQLFDINNDTLVDLIVGKKNGYLSYYQNTGSLTNPMFTHITDSLGKVCVVTPNVSYFGYSNPCFFKDSAEIRLFSGSESGYIYYYKDIVQNLNGQFTASDTLLIHIDSDSAVSHIDNGSRSSVAVYDFNSDGFPDIVSGNLSGGLTYYTGVKSNAFVNIEEKQPEPSVEFNIYPNPADDILNIFVGTDKQQVYVEIFNHLGKKVFEGHQSGQTNTTINISRFNSGIYICKVCIPGEKSNMNLCATKKFIIAR